MRGRIGFFIAALVLFVQIAAAEVIVPPSVPNAKIVGQGKYSFMFWDVYRASLYAPEGRWDPARPYALSIEYFREIEGKDIADRSIEEMRKEGFADEARLAIWNAELRAIFPDVKPGMVLTAVRLPGVKSVFYDGDKFIGDVKDDEFGQRFFGIWLAETTSAPGLRRALLGQS